MGIPKQAKKVFQGEIFSIYQWPQKMFDGSYKIFERAKRQDTVIIIATVKNKIVLLKQRQPGTSWFYCTPSGRMDIKGEKPLVAAKRELLEETGMVAQKVFLWKKREKKGKVISTIYYYIAQNCKKITEQSLDNGEQIKVKLISFTEFTNLVNSTNANIGELFIDLFKASTDKIYKQYLTKLIFG